jgi:hypothetical protein
LSIDADDMVEDRIYNLGLPRVLLRTGRVAFPDTSSARSANSTHPNLVKLAKLAPNLKPQLAHHYSASVQSWSSLFLLFLCHHSSFDPNFRFWLVLAE